MPKTAEIKFISEDFDVGELDHLSWDSAREIKTKSLWSGQRAVKKRRFVTQMLWSDKSLYVRFKANQGERPLLNHQPDLTKKTKALWEWDVCEMFLAPDVNDPSKYFEFEVAPTGEWLDLRIHQQSEKRHTDWDFESGMKTSAVIEHDLITTAFKVDWASLGAAPKEGDTWKGNLLRAVGRGNGRGYLAWSATRTEKPNFHVPERFGDFRFVK